MAAAHQLSWKPLCTNVHDVPSLTLRTARSATAFVSGTLGVLVSCGIPRSAQALANSPDPSE